MIGHNYQTSEGFEDEFKDLLSDEPVQYGEDTFYRWQDELNKFINFLNSNKIIPSLNDKTAQIHFSAFGSDVTTYTKNHPNFWYIRENKPGEFHLYTNIKNDYGRSQHILWKQDTGWFIDTVIESEEFDDLLGDEPVEYGEDKFEEEELFMCDRCGDEFDPNHEGYYFCNKCNRMYCESCYNRLDIAETEVDGILACGKCTSPDDITQLNQNKQLDEDEFDDLAGDEPVQQGEDVFEEGGFSDAVNLATEFNSLGVEPYYGKLNGRMKEVTLMVDGEIYLDPEFGEQYQAWIRYDRYNHVYTTIDVNDFYYIEWRSDAEGWTVEAIS
jgi:hypothetical protein